jgi:DNA-binding response OmpR family regulator
VNKWILFVDDDKDWRVMVGDFLKDAEYQVLTAANATEAMTSAEGHKLGLIILDLDLDGEDGLMLMKFLARNQPGVPIILYTGMAHDDEAIFAMLQQGAHQYVRKGPLSELLKAVQMSFH